MIKYTFVYGTSEHTPALLESARMASLKAFCLVAANVGLLVLDRYGIEQEVMKTCQIWDIPLLVIGTTARPRSGVSMRHYERAILTLQEHQDREAQLRRYALIKASGLVILGDSPDCRAMRFYAQTVNKIARHVPEPTPLRPLPPTSEWLKTLEHFNLSKV